MKRIDEVKLLVEENRLLKLKVKKLEQENKKITNWYEEDKTQITIYKNLLEESRRMKSELIVNYAQAVKEQVIKSVDQYVYHAVCQSKEVELLKSKAKEIVVINQSLQNQIQGYRSVVQQKT